MDMTTLAIIELLENPFYLADALAWTANNYTQRKMQIYESYIIIPILLNSDFRKIFLRTNKSGRIHALFEDKKYSLYSFNEEVEYYKNKVDEAIIILLNKPEISLDLKNSEVILINKYKTFLDGEYKKVLKNIGEIFSKYRIEEIFNFLGVEKL